MRSLGQIDGRKPTERFVAYLLTLKIKTHIEGVDEQQDRWEVWIRNEDQMVTARKELSEFLANPNDPRYDSAMKEATRILEEEQRARQTAAKNIRRIEMSNGSRLTRGRVPPLTLTLAILAVIVSLLSGFMAPRENNKWGQTIVNELSFVEPSALESSKGDPAASLKRGELWRIITPIFMHGSPLHLAMNILLLVSLGRLTERIQGTPKYALFILMLAVFPNLLQGLSPEWMRGSPNFVGISGVVYGLFGYIWIRSTLHPEMGIVIPLPMVVIFVGMIVLGLAVGLSDAVPGWRLADLCHLGGLLVGIAVAYASEQK